MPKGPHKQIAAAWERLTPAQKDVARRVLLGYSDAEIAVQRGCAEGTVRVTKSNALGRLGVRNYAAVYRWYWEHGPGRLEKPTMDLQEMEELF